VTGVALLALALLAYTYLGYPIAIGVLARLFPVRPAPPAPGNADALPSVSVCLPVFNAAQLLRAKVQSLIEQDYPAERLEILITCDGCSDDSETVARALAAAPEAAGRIRVFTLPARGGKPAALNTLVPEARGDLLLLNDVRQPLSPNAARALVAAMADPGVGCATGNLVLAGGAASGVYWRYENWIRRQESRFRGVVGMTGAIAMMRRADYEPLPEPLILDDVWIPTRLGLRGKRVAAVPEAAAYDTAFEDDDEFRRKVRTLAGNYQLFALVPALLDPTKNPVWFETVSHKVMRLCAPWLMAALAASSVAAAARQAEPCARVMAVLAGAQLAFYAAAAFGKRAGRLAGVARTFVVLNAAAVVGLFKYLSGRQRVTW
jgi:biofilm PGA synthesis N-glycosyltransferase PgaC